MEFAAESVFVLYTLDIRERWKNIAAGIKLAKRLE
jgi:hypothetical protein